MRQYRTQNGYPSEGMIVNVRGGVYPVSATFSLKALDSGTTSAPVIWQAYQNESVRLLAGLMVTNFEAVTDPGILARLSPAARQSVKVANVGALGLTTFPAINQGGLHMQLYQDSSATHVARFPNDGWLLIRDVPANCASPILGDATKGNYHCGRIGYSDPRPSRWAPTNDKVMYGYWCWDWASEFQPITSVDTINKQIVMTPPYHHYGYLAGQRYYYLNILEELDTIGEWYLDRAARMLYFWPAKPLTNNNVLFGTRNLTMWSLAQTRNIIVRNMIFEGSGNAAIAITGGTRNTIDRCTIRNMQCPWAVTIDSSGTRNGCSNCTFNNLDGGAISLFGGNRKTLTRADNYAVNNHLYNFCKVGKGSGGIDIWGVGNRVAHNRIHDAPQEAILYGGNDIVIEYNEIYNMVTETNDAGAVYAGRNPSFQGDTIRYNYFRDIGELVGHGNASIYLDDGVSGTEIFGNVFVNGGIPGDASFGAIFFNGGRYNNVANNIFINCQQAYSQGYWSQEKWEAIWSYNPQHSWLTVDIDLTSPPWSVRYPWAQNYLTDNRPNTVICNLVYNCKKFCGPYRPTLADNLETTRDLGFVDSDAGKFALRSDSWVYSSMPCFAKLPFDSMGMLPPPATAAVAPQKPIRAAHALMGIRMIQGGISLDLRLENNREKVVISIYDASGKRVAAEEVHRQNVGKQQVVLDTRILAPGFYMLNAKADGWTETRNFMLYR